MKSTSIGTLRVEYFRLVLGIPNTRYAKVIGITARAIYNAKNADGMIQETFLKGLSYK